MDTSCSTYAVALQGMCNVHDPMYRQYPEEPIGNVKAIDHRPLQDVEG